MTLKPPSLILIRHGQPEISPDTPAPQWPLSAQGHAAAASLARQLQGLTAAAAISSPEPKALQTLEAVAGVLGVGIAADPDLEEHRRPAWDFATPEAARARVHAALTRPDDSIEGAETGAQALARFDAALRRRSDRPLIVGSHGTILSLWLAWTWKVDPVELWGSLGLAEAILLDGSGALIARVRGDPM